MLTVLQENYQLEYSASYTGNVHGETTIEGYQYCRGLKRAFESLTSEQYRSLILTDGCIAVSIIYCADNCQFKVFDSYARDIYGKSHPEGTCILLDIPSANNLVQCFQSLYGVTDVYELKGLHITKYDMAASNSVKDVLNTPSDQHNCLKNHHCFAIALYSSICFPNSVTIFGIKINVDVDKLSHGKLAKLSESRISLKTLILRNNGKTGFLMWISSYCAACIYQQNTSGRLFSLLTYEDGNSPAMKHIKHISGVNKLVEAINDIIQNRQQCQTVG